MTRLRVLLSARDPGGAASIKALLPALRADPRAEVTVAASGAAFDILTTAGAAPLRFALADGTTHVPTGGPVEALLGATRRLLSRLEPDVIVVGVSSLGVGLDEALLACAGGVPTFALQDYPGDANAIGGKFAGLYFVRDDAAARLTRARHGVATLPVGSLRHNPYASLDIGELRSQTRARLGAGIRSVVGFFGQPAEIPGQEQGFRDLVGALARRSPAVLVILREHPKSPELRTAHRAALEAAGLDAVDATGLDPIEPGSRRAISSRRAFRTARWTTRSSTRRARSRSARRSSCSRHPRRVPSCGTSRVRRSRTASGEAWGRSPRRRRTWRGSSTRC